MKTYLISAINAFTLILMGIWGYSVSEDPSFTAFIPVIIGAILLLFVRGVKNKIKISLIIASILTFVILIGLIKPLTGAIDRSDSASIVRVVIMMITTI
ncbi:MAG TPA: hypothetical protein VJ855_06565, partial [Marinilabiliaceae bacterium]|nr:hypothetical protein [Marinilabiliaceae bacterium]